MAERIDATVFRLELNRALTADHITVTIRTITATDVWVVAWRINGTATVRIVHAALDQDRPTLVAATATIIQRSFQELS